MQRVSFNVTGEPVPKARPRVVRRGGRTWSYTPKRVTKWENEVREEAKKHFTAPFKGPVALIIGFYLSRPKSRRKDNYAPVTPDLDNLEKSILDGLNEVAYEDDKLVVVKSAAKFYVRYGEKPHVNITVTPLVNQLRIDEFPG